MNHLLAASLMALALTACAGEAQMNSATEASDPAAPTVAISEGYVMPPLKGRDVAAGFFTATGVGEGGAIVSADSPFADSVEVHTHLMEGGVMKMREVDRVPVAAGETVLFEPGGYHLMIFGFKRAENQNAMPVTLTLESGETMELMLPIRER